MIGATAHAAAHGVTPRTVWRWLVIPVPRRTRAPRLPDADDIARHTQRRAVEKTPARHTATTAARTRHPNEPGLAVRHPLGCETSREPVSWCSHIHPRGSSNVHRDVQPQSQKARSTGDGVPIPTLIPIDAHSVPPAKGWIALPWYR